MAFQYNHYYEIYNGGKYVNLNGDHENNVVNNGEKVHHVCPHEQSRPALGTRTLWQ